MREKKLYSRMIYRGRVVDLYKDNITLADGREAVREVIKHKEAICVLPVEGDSIILVKQFRYPVNKELIEIPAGIIESGEEPEEAAERELKEETGYRAKSMKKVLSFYSSPGFTNEKLHLFIAEGLEPGKQQMDPDEEIDVIKVRGEDLYDKILNGEIEDSKTILAVLYYLSMQ